MEIITGGVTAAKGFLAAGVEADADERKTGSDGGIGQTRM